MAEDKAVSELPKNGGPHIVTKTFVDEYDSGRIEGEPDEESCGWGPFKPGFCQRFRDPKWVLFWLCWAGAIQVGGCFVFKNKYHISLFMRKNAYADSKDTK